MYKLNPLKRNVLLTADEVAFHAATDHTPDLRTLESSIIIAEERFIVPILGRTFYNVLVNSKNVEVTLANKVATQTLVGSSYTVVVGDIINAYEFMGAAAQTLWLSLLWKLCAECTLFVALPDNYVKFTSAGVVHGRPLSNAMIQGGEVTPDLRSMKWIMDKKMMDRIDPLLEALTAYLCENKGSFADWDSTGCVCADDKLSSRKTAWISDIYNDDEPCGGCP